MKNIPEERLSTIGKLIEVTREEKRNKSQNKYTMKSFVEGICTVNTLKRIEAGEIARIEDVYVELLDKLNLKLGYFPAVDDAILELMDPLYEAIEYYRVEDISKYCDMGLRVLGKVKNYVYYSELYDLLMATKEYFEEAKIISLSKMERFRNEYTLFDEKYHSLFKIMVFYRGQAEAYHNSQMYKKIVKELGFLETNNISERIICLNYSVNFEKYITFKERAISLEKILRFKKNYIRLLDVYTYMIYASITIERKVSEQYMRNVEDLLQMDLIPNSKKMDYYSNIATALHENKLYKEALEYYQKMLIFTDKNNIWFPSLICMVHCQRVLGKEIDMPLLCEEQINGLSNLLKRVYKYFTSDELKPFVKINYIIKELAPMLVYDGIIEIFRDEMELLVRETGSYKSMYIYNQIVKGNLEKWNDDFIRKCK